MGNLNILIYLNPKRDSILLIEYLLKKGVNITIVNKKTFWKLEGQNYTDIIIEELDEIDKKP